MSEVEGEVEPVGTVGTMPGTSGFTMAAFRSEDVPVGTLLYSATTIATLQSAIAEKDAEIGRLRRLVGLLQDDLASLADDHDRCDG